MAAATISNRCEIEMWPMHVYSFDMSAMTSDQLENVTFVGPSGFKADEVTYEIITPPVGHDPVSVYHEDASDSVTAKTVALRVSCTNIASCVVRFHVKFYASKGGGIS
jgi:hypothetical protein